MGNGEWGMGNEKLKMGNGKWEIENGKLHITCDSFSRPRDFVLNKRKMGEVTLPCFLKT